MDWLIPYLHHGQANANFNEVIVWMEGASLAGWRPFMTTEQAIMATDARDLPLSVLPVAESSAGLLALDRCSLAIERGVAPLLFQGNSSAFFESLGLKPSFCQSASTERDLDIRDHPTAFSEHAARVFRGDAAQEGIASAWSNVFLRPLYTAASMEQIAAAQAAVLSLERSTGMDPLLVRLAKSGSDAELWRRVAAERAVANRVRDALRCFEGAAFWGHNKADILAVLDRLYRAMRWEVGIRVVEFHRRRLFFER